MEGGYVIWIALAYIIVINIVGFLMMKIDKDKAIKGQWRTSEKYLLSLAIIGGSLGMLMGMRQFRHKTNKPLFKIGIPAIVVLQFIIARLVINM